MYCLSFFLSIIFSGIYSLFYILFTFLFNLFFKCILFQPSTYSILSPAFIPSLSCIFIFFIAVTVLHLSLPNDCILSSLPPLYFFFIFPSHSILSLSSFYVLYRKFFSLFLFFLLHRSFTSFLRSSAVSYWTSLRTCHFNASIFPLIRSLYSSYRILLLTFDLMSSLPSFYASYRISFSFLPLLQCIPFFPLIKR